MRRLSLGPPVRAIIPMSRSLLMEAQALNRIIDSLLMVVVIARFPNVGDFEIALVSL
jgi:hypothetical protein